METQEHERLFPLMDVSKRLQARGVPGVSECTLRRWVTRGSGRARIRLQVWKVGGRVFTSEAALDRFIEGTTAGKPVVRTAWQRIRAIERADKELAAAGY